MHSYCKKCADKAKLNKSFLALYFWTISFILYHLMDIYRFSLSVAYQQFQFNLSIPTIGTM